MPMVGDVVLEWDTCKEHKYPTEVVVVMLISSEIMSDLGAVV